MKFLIIRNNETIGGLKINDWKEQQDVTWFFRKEITKFFKKLTDDFLKFDRFQFLGLRNKFVEIDLWNKCSVSCNNTTEGFEVFINGDDGMLKFEIKPLNNIRFFEVK
jgi:hypothetical protein